MQHRGLASIAAALAGCALLATFAGDWLAPAALDEHELDGREVSRAECPETLRADSEPTFDLPAAPPQVEGPGRQESISYEYEPPVVDPSALAPDPAFAIFAQKYADADQEMLASALDELLVRVHEERLALMREKISQGEGRVVGANEGVDENGVREIRASGPAPGQHAGMLSSLPTGEVLVVYDTSGFDQLPSQPEIAFVQGRIQELRLANRARLGASPVGD